MMAVGAMGQEVYPTKFLGIPIDGTKEEMIQKIQAKGFTYDRVHDCLNGQFNGSDVHIFVATNGDKVWRVMVSETANFSEGEIRIRFNNLLWQFQKNKKYIPLKESNYRLSEEENISYEMVAHNKRYSCEYLQITHDHRQLFNQMIEQLRVMFEQNGVKFSTDK